MNRRQSKKTEKKAYLRFLGIDIEEDNLVHDCWIEGEDEVIASGAEVLSNEEYDKLVSKEAFRCYQSWNRFFIENSKYIKLPARKILIHLNGGNPSYTFLSLNGEAAEHDLTKTQMFDMLNDEEKSIVVFHRYFHKY